MTEGSHSHVTPMSGSEFRARLRELGRTQSGFAREIGGSHRSVTRWISEGPPPEVAYLIDLLATLELHIGQSTTRTDDKSNEYQVDSALDRLLVQATASGRRAELIAGVHQWLRTVADKSDEVRSTLGNSNMS
ncbi:helix-turn-helix transcriptional regulator [Methylobacterium sp. J-059]|uniref:helix-turn-helix transcriptional regulator n=1 Tax=Methylobacterium sp. J-059 TaxID=2836643 RepID=UPI001FBB2C35|nr:helix-turn-helix transcriptional regulator [Methylobacterium sp. J-059]MCJ2042238.1 helix-turn-helix transcriptional regulator [Methylobacterium sp. J-059]